MADANYPNFNGNQNANNNNMGGNQNTNYPNFNNQNNQNNQMNNNNNNMGGNQNANYPIFQNGGRNATYPNATDQTRQGVDGVYDSSFCGLQPLESCCCCTLKTGVKVLAVLQLIGGICAIFGVFTMIALQRAISESDSEYIDDDSNLIGYIILYGFMVLNLPVGIIGMQAADRLDHNKAKSYYGCNIFMCLGTWILQILSQYILCQSLDDDDSYGLCDDFISKTATSLVFNILFAMYFLWVMQSYAARLGAGETELCMYGSGYRYHQHNFNNQGNLNAPLVAEGRAMNQGGQPGYNQGYNQGNNNNNNQGYRQ